MKWIFVLSIAIHAQNFKIIQTDRQTQRAEFYDFVCIATDSCSTTALNMFKIYGGGFRYEIRNKCFVSKHCRVRNANKAQKLPGNEPRNQETP